MQLQGKVCTELAGICDMPLKMPFAQVVIGEEADLVDEVDLEAGWPCLEPILPAFLK